jgi:hypothetical protein
LAIAMPLSRISFAMAGLLQPAANQQKARWWQKLPSEAERSERLGRRV